MAEYKPYLIAGFKTAKAIGVEPFLAPDDAFPTLLNARVNKGVLSKRAGYSELADTGNSNPIMGFGAAGYRGHDTILVADTKRIYRLNITAGSVTDLSGSDTFEGTNKDYFWFQNWRDKCYMVNGADPIYTWDESSETLEAMSTGDVTIDTCQMIFQYKNRLLFVGPVVGSTWYPRRLYYTDVNSDNVSSSNYVNCPANIAPVTGGYIGEIPCVIARNSIWKIRYTRNTDTPFTWELQTRDYGSLARFACSPFKDGLVFMDHNHLLFYDGHNVQEYDKLIRGIIDEMDSQKFWYATAAKLREDPVIYMSYCRDGQTWPDRILEFNFDEGNFCQHDIAAHCLFGFDGALAVSGDVLDSVVGSDGDTGEDFEFSDLHTIRHSNRALTFAGGRTGKIYRLNHGTDDDGDDITVDIRTARLNPFKKAGLKARLGWVKVLVDTDSSASYSWALYKDTGSTAVKTGTLDCSGSGDKNWQTLYCDGEVGNFFRLRFYHTESANAPQIHALMFGFKPAARLEGY